MKAESTIDRLESATHAGNSLFIGPKSHGSARYLIRSGEASETHSPFFRKDAGDLLEKPVLASVITAPAPNRGAVAQNEPRNLSLVEAALRRRAEMVLHVAQAHGVESLVLGAWGCGVFRNDPAKVASIFASLIKPPGRFAGVFRDVLFSVYDRAEPALTLRAFANTLK